MYCIALYLCGFVNFVIVGFIKMDKLCGSKFWDLNSTWYTNDPDFTECFKNTALIWIPCVFLWVSLPLEMYHLQRSEIKDVPFNYFGVIKLIFISVSAYLELTVAIFNILQKFQPVYYCSSIILFFTLILFLLLTLFNIKRGIRSSGFLFTFSFLLVICEIPRIRDLIRNGHRNSIYNVYDLKNISYVLYFVSIIIVFFLNCFADEKTQHSLHVTQEHIYPFKKASFLSRLCLTWFEPYIWKNYKKSVTNYLWDLESKDNAKDICQRHEKKRYGGKFISNDINIINILIKEHGFTFWLCTCLRTILEVMTVVLYIVFDWLMANLQEKQFFWRGYIYMGLFFIVTLSQTLIQNKYSEICTRLEVRVRGAVISCLYKKALRISNTVRKEYTVSDIVNLMSIDTFQMQNAVRQFHFLFALCFQMVASFLYLWALLGPSIITCIAVIIITFLGSHRTMIHMKKLQQKEMKNKDMRSKFMQEVFSGIKVLKMYAWEHGFKKVALRLRTCENKTLRQIAITSIIFHNIFLNSPTMMYLLAYLSYVLVTNTIMDIRVTFVSLVIFNSFRLLSYNIPMNILFLQQAHISANRMNKFLNSEELNDDAISHDQTVERLIMHNATFSWISSEGPAVLQNINIKVPGSSLIAIVGAIGSGKSSLISAFLGDMYKISGYVNTKGKIAYVPQQAWILNATVKENITLGEPFDQRWYEKTIETCALKPDLNGLPDGDLTEIGEKGVNLSGGQKQRISLARAVYRNADIYFFDDPLSAVDSSVASHIFQHVLGSHGVLQNKTRILVTHATKFFPFMDKIIVMKGGRISEIGEYQEFLNKEGDFSNFLRSKCNFESSELQQDADSTVDKKLLENITPENLETEQEPNYSSKTKISSKLIKEEHVKSKRESAKLYWIYFSAAGIVSSIASLSLYLLFQVIMIFSNFWLSEWITSEDKSTRQSFYLSIFASFGVAQAISGLLGSATFYMNAVKAASYFYNRLLDNVLQWPMSTFDSTPIGRILTRLGDDVYMLDNSIGSKLFPVLPALLKCLSVVILTIFIIPISCTVVIPLVIMFYIIQKNYIVLTYQLKRIESIHKAPFYSHLVETLTGIQSIRAYGFQTKFVSQCYKKSDLYSAAYHSSATCARWFCSRVEFLESLFLCSITLIVLLKRDSLNINIMVLQIFFAIQVIRGIAFLVDVLNEVEDGLISAERINEYLEYPMEPPWDIPSMHVADTWPDKGEIVFDNYKLRYREGLDYVLKGLTFTIKSGEKIGIVGRTGAGKTSIILGLFRIVEPVDGTIFIDGIDITKLGLHTLRSRLTVIPQDPVLFSGTIRFNLDPLEQHSDEHLWNVLKKSHLESFVQNLPEGLYYKIEEGGQNLSFGQRQLICLARALLRKTKILVLDEATASVDVKTDQLIQKTIRDEFSDCTVITIAHRLNTLQDYDKILILDGGCVVNFDTAENLLHTENSQFRKMVVASD